MIQRIVLVFSLAALVGCGLFPNPRERRTQPTEVRQVPYAARAGVDSALRQRVLVLPFTAVQTTLNDKVLATARQSLVRSLFGSKQIVIVNNRAFPQDLKNFLSPDRDYDMNKVARVAASLGISAVIEGKILQVKAKRIGDEVGMFRKVKARSEVSVRVRVVSTRNGREILSNVRQAAIESDTTRVMKYSYSDRYLEQDPNLIRLATRKAFKGTVLPIVKAIEKLNWEGRVALISGERVFVNAGRLSGLQIGDILKITEEGEEVYDPDSGKYIGQAPGRMKGTVEVVTYFGKDGAITIVHSGSGFKENDRVELY